MPIIQKFDISYILNHFKKNSIKVSKNCIASAIICKVIYLVNVKLKILKKYSNNEISFTMCKNAVPTSLKEMCFGNYVAFLKFILDGDQKLTKIA